MDVVKQCAINAESLKSFAVVIWQMMNICAVIVEIIILQESVNTLAQNVESIYTVVYVNNYLGMRI